MNWKALVKTEPRLGKLLDDIEAADSHLTRSFCAVTAWHGSGGRPGLKMRMYRLAGFGSANPELRTREAYELATQTLYGALPPCRGCACVIDDDWRCTEAAAAMV